MKRESRRDYRYRAQLQAQLMRGKTSVRLLTDDVSFRGAFLRTDTQATLRQLVRVVFTMPDGHEVGGSAMVVHVVPPSVAAKQSDKTCRLG